MVEAHVVVRTGVGLHARPAAMLVQEASRYPCKVSITYGSKEADGRSILQVLALGVQDGESISIRVEGDQEGKALDALVELLERGLKSK